MVGLHALAVVDRERNADFALVIGVLQEFRLHPRIAFLRLFD